MSTNRDELKGRTKQLGLRVIRMAETLPAGRASDIIAKQILRSATSVGANYRAACRARSDAEVISKLSIVLEEADETMYWLEILVEAKIVPEGKLSALMTEANEIVAIVVTALKTLKARQNLNSRNGRKNLAEEQA